MATLTSACENVFENDPGSIAGLNEELRTQRWKLFKRLRHHLYALKPNEQTKPWIRESILDYGYYDQQEYSYEFQRTILSACNHFGEILLTKEERGSIFDAILSGPPKEVYRKWMGERFTEDLFIQRQRYFHRKQFRPFASVLFGKYELLYQCLEDESDFAITDEDYGRIGEFRGGTVTSRSPQSPAELAGRTDEELLGLINQWDEEYREEDNWLVEVTIEALAQAFQAVFMESILPDDERLRFWLECKERIKRPIYVRAITQSMQEYIRGGNSSRLLETFDFCEWVLSHPDGELRGGFESGDESAKDPNWNSSRRAVCNLIEVCLTQDVGLPSSSSGKLAQLLEMLCTQFDWRLYINKQVFPGREDQYAEAINNTRSLALQHLIRFGLWKRGNDSQSDITAVTNILERRLSSTSDIPLALPERAALAVNYPYMLYLDEAWSTEHKSDFFPQNTLHEWRVAFASLLRYTSPNKQLFEVLREDYGKAVQHLTKPEQGDDWTERVGYLLGRDLFLYYMWGMFPLEGEGSLLNGFYRKVEGDTKMGTSLFRRIGANLQNSSGPLDKSLLNRLISFFEWRLEKRRFKEMEGFDLWLAAECLDPDWRLDSYLRILEIGQPEGWEIYGHVKALHEMLFEQTAKVLQCFAKLTGGLQIDASHIRSEAAKDIILAGLESEDDAVRRNAEIARHNLLSRGNFEILGLQIQEE